MATKNFVPRADLEGGLGTDSKRWASGSFGRIQFLQLSGSAASTGSFGRLEIAGNTNLVGNITIGGNMTLGDADTDSINITADLTSNLIPNVDSTFDIGSSTKFWRNAYIDSVTTTGNVSGSASSTGSFGKILGDGSELTGITSGIFQTTGSVEATTNDVQITGSLVVSASATSSTAIFTNNIQNGYPTSNNWGENLDGSYFNNFNNTTHVSEILRFIAGAMSHSLDVADAAPNTKTFGTVTTSHTEGSTQTKNSLLNGVLGSTYENARLSAAWTGSSFIDMSETGSYKSALDYLEFKGWVQSSDRGTNDDDVGTNPFHGTYASRIPNTIQTQATFGTNSFSASANTAGSTSVSSDSNFFGLGSLNSGAARAYSVRVIATQSFSDNYADETPDQNSTFTTSSLIDYTTSAFGTSGDGLTLSKIVTSQPAVIPSAFQDGDFAVGGGLSGRKYTGGATSATNISASGYYATHDVKVGIQTGSMSGDNFEFRDGSDSNTRFYLYIGGVTTDITNSQPTAVVSQELTRTAFSAT